MWNDTDIALAYLITFRSHGTWLHGDERGSIDREHNHYRTPYISPNERWRQYNAATLRDEVVILNATQRECVEMAVRETCIVRDWLLRALNVRTNHVHIVVSTGAVRPERALNAFKANATRQMRRSGCWLRPSSPWADKGSARYLWNEGSIERAVSYVVDGQGGELPKFD